MKTISLRLPESVHRKLRDMADKEGVSMNQFISLAVSEKISALLTVDYLNERAAKADPKQFKDLLSRVPDVMPDEVDKLR
jgi:hypothetical protein